MERLDTLAIPTYVPFTVGALVIHAGFLAVAVLLLLCEYTLDGTDTSNAIAIAANITASVFFIYLMFVLSISCKNKLKITNRKRMYAH
jgi:hypothetical protein